MKIRPLFSKYQKFLLAFANTGFGKAYLGAEDLPIAYVSPDGIHYKLDELIYKGVFYSCSPYLKKFRLALESLAIIEENGLRIKEKFEYVIPHFQELISPQKGLPLLMRASPLTAYPDADPETTTVDGFVRNEVAPNWNTCHDATSGSDASPSGPTGSLQNSKEEADGSDWRINRGFFLFDTSSIPDGATVIDSTTISLMPVSKGVDTNGIEFGIVQSSPASNTDLTAADFDQCGSINNPTEGATRIAGSAMSVDVYSDFTLNATGKGWISKTGITKLGARGSLDLDDTAPTGKNNVSFYMADTAGTGSDPKLVVSYSTVGNYGYVF